MSSGNTSVVDTSLSGGFDISFDLPDDFPTEKYVGLVSNIVAHADDSDSHYFYIERLAGGDMRLEIYREDGITPIELI
jgi:hypothetical protein